MDVGDIFHGLKLLNFCGGGAFGEVFYCEDVTHKKMAVKIIHKKRLNGECLRELKGISNYRRISENSPNLIQIYQVEEDEDTFYYTMEPADSLSGCGYKADTLAARLMKGPVRDAEIFPLLSGIFNGIRTLHAAGFAHRDIKPENILFVKGIPKLADMGLLSSLSMTMSSLAGTFIFIPPEIRSSDHFEKYDSKSRQQSDLYAFGKVIYCVVTGRSPEKFPSIPENLPITPAVKFFILLSFRLCEKKPAKRLTELQKIESDFAAYQRKMNHKDTWLDKLVKKIFCFDKLLFLKRFCGKPFHFWMKGFALLLFISLLGAGFAFHAFSGKTENKKAPDAKENSVVSEEQRNNEKITFRLSQDTELEMIKIHPGSFLMGSPENEVGRNPGNFPAETLHKVTLTQDFWIGKFTITQKQYRTIMGNNPGDPKGDDLPVVFVSWYDAMFFCSMLNSKLRKKIPPGYRFSLPTEAQWEYACRAGTSAALNNGKQLLNAYGYCPNLNEVAWCRNNSRQIQPVGQKKANNWGIHDMLGNVWEWCYDGPGAKTDVNPFGPMNGVRIGRGGSFDCNARYCRSAMRAILDPKKTDGNYGFRVVLVRDRGNDLPMLENIMIKDV